MTANAEWEEYFDHFVPPSTLQHNQKAVQDFASANRQIGHDLVLITVSRHFKPDVAVISVHLGFGLVWRYYGSFGEQHSSVC